MSSSSKPQQNANHLSTAYRWAFVVLVAVATALRFVGYNWGLQYLFHPDELRIIDGAWRVYWGIPSMDSDYGLLPMRLIAAVWSAIGILSPSFAEAPTSADNFLLAMSSARLLAATVGVASILFFYHRLQSIVGRGPAWIAAFAMAVAPLHIQLSHFITVDIFLFFFSLVAIFSAYDFLGSRNGKSLMLLGVSVGCAVGTKLSALPLLALAFLCVFLAHILPRPRRGALSHALVHSVILGCTFLAVFLASNPGAMALSAWLSVDSTNPEWWHAGNFLNGSHKFQWNFLLVKGALSPLWILASRLSLIAIILNVLWAFGVLAFFGLLYVRPPVLAPYKRLVFTFVAAAALVALSLSQSTYFFPRYAILLLPCFCILSGLGLSRSFSNPRSVWAATSCLVLALGLLIASAFTTLYIRPDARITIGEKVVEHVPAGSTVCIEDDGFAGPVLDVSRFRVKVLPVYSLDLHMRAQVVQERITPKTLRDRKIELPKQWSLAESNQHIQDLLSQCPYIIISNRIWDEISLINTPHPLADLYRRMLAGSAEFTSIASVQETPSLFAISIDDSWSDPTLRIFEHPAFQLFQNKSITPR